MVARLNIKGINLIENIMKRGRKKLPEDQFKGKRIGVKITEKQRAVLKLNAIVAGLSISDYVRRELGIN